MIEEIARRLAEAARTGKPEGLLFHGSGEPWSGTPVAGGDGLFWTTTSPVIAQQYIPASGSSYIVGKPPEFRRGDRVLPEQHSFWRQVAERVSGMVCGDVELDARGNLKSWIIPAGWPTYADCLAWLETEMGYAWPSEHGSVDIHISRIDGVETLMPAYWRLEGTLLVTLSDGLSFRDLRSRDEGDLLDPDHRRYGDFENAESSGDDGVIINDFAQTDHGNMGHVSYGMTTHGLASREWLCIPACRHPIEWGNPTSITAEIVAWSEIHALAAPARTP